MNGQTQTLFINGMRRSGTTIVLDAILSTGEAHGIYEPLAAAKRAAVGGGSGMRKIDYFETIRAGRAAFMGNRPELKPGDFNYGAPGNPLLEYETSLPDHMIEYLQSLRSSDQPNIFKFTRMHHKIAELIRVDPTGALALVIRDPRAVVTSYLYGKNQIHRQRVEDTFFDRNTADSAWSSSAFFEHLVSTPQLAHMRSCPDFLKVLLLWRDNAVNSIAAAQAHFESRWYLLRHHEFCINPRSVLAELGDATGFAVPDGCGDWAENHVKPRSDIHLPTSPHWDTAFNALEMRPFLETYQLLKPADSDG